ncbi:MAG: hypothetical protein ACFFC3_00935 [Candidatus Odinarchaeota archaeon]
MPKLQKYMKKIRRYKEKLKELIIRIGLSYPIELELIDETLTKLILPCHLGIMFFGDFDESIFKKISINLNHIFDSFFFDIKNLGTFNFSIKQFYKGVKKEFRELKKTSSKIKIHPTNKFYQILISRRREENLGMILAITDLPIFSSTNNNILFLFGEANLKHRCCVVSSLILKESYYNRPVNQFLFEERIIKEIIHEVGHLILGPDHCDNLSCVMRFSENIEEIDQKKNGLCEKCKSKLIKTREEFNF